MAFACASSTLTAAASRCMSCAHMRRSRSSCVVTEGGGREQLLDKDLGWRLVTHVTPRGSRGEKVVANLFRCHCFRAILTRALFSQGARWHNGVAMNDDQNFLI